MEDVGETGSADDDIFAPDNAFGLGKFGSPGIDIRRGGTIALPRPSSSSGRYAKSILNDVFLVISFPHKRLLLYVRMKELPIEV